MEKVNVSKKNNKSRQKKNQISKVLPKHSSTKHSFTKYSLPIKHRHTHMSLTDIMKANSDRIDNTASLNSLSYEDMLDLLEIVERENKGLPTTRNAVNDKVKNIAQRISERQKNITTRASATYDIKRINNLVLQYNRDHSDIKTGREIYDKLIKKE